MGQKNGYRLTQRGALTGKHRIGRSLPFPMHPDDEVCLCFHVSLRKIRNFCQREKPPVASLVSECLGAGTGCGWCIPFLKHLHKQASAGVEPDLNVSPEQYARTRLTYHLTKERDETVVRQAIGHPPSPADPASTIPRNS